MQAAAAVLLTAAAFWFAASGQAEDARLIAPDLGGETTRPVDGKTAFTFLSANAEPRHQRAFFFGNRLFNTNWVKAPASVKSFDGLGPVFNRVSCSGCHTQDGRGRPPLEAGEKLTSMLVRLSVAAADGGVVPHPAYGDQIGEAAIAGVPAEAETVIRFEPVSGTYGDGTPYEILKPELSFTALAHGPLPHDTMLSPRVAPQVIGLGLLEAVPDADLIERADPDDGDGDGISGRVNEVRDPRDGRIRIGRFGWKASQVDLETQNAGAAIGDIGLTNPLFPEENCTPAQTACLSATRGQEPDLPRPFLDKLTLYTRLIAVPAQRNPDDSEVRRGSSLFAEFGCAACHRSEMKTGKAALAELANQTFHPFTDLLLHDMGDGLADNRPDFGASGREWRTPPLWGLGLVEKVNGHNRLLHDGRARGFAEAILWHGGEAKAAREAFRLADKRDREALVTFLKSL
jgi:CxxC motif-containing protein (DUF1111 family)